MRYIRHRVNTIEELRKLPRGLGAEIDLRSTGGNLILAHDPFAPGDSFETFAQLWAATGMDRGPLILNPKEDGLEPRAIEVLKRCGIHEYFFLDLTIPTTVRLSTREKVREIAVRVSEYEPPAAALRFQGLVDWIWLDSFTGVPPDLGTILPLKGKFKLCLVSPELQGYPIETISKYHSLSPHLDAICTKRPELWGWSPKR